MSEKEATARIKINKLLEAAGWRFFQEGDTPANNQVSKITCEWIEEFANTDAPTFVLPEYKTVSSIECPEAFK